jgi:hypothetical protein
MTLLTQREAATLLRLSERTLERWASCWHWAEVRALGSQHPLSPHSNRSSHCILQC